MTRVYPRDYSSRNTNAKLILPSSSHRYMLAPEFKPLVLELNQQVLAAVVGEVTEHDMHHAMEYRPDLLTLRSSRDVSAAGELRGIALATCSSLKDLVTWARTPDPAEPFMAAHVQDARRLANLDEPFALERYELMVSRRFGRESEVEESKPTVCVPCEGCFDTDVHIFEDGTVSCSLTGILCPFEWLPVVASGRRASGRRALVCCDCAAEAYAIGLAGFAPLYLDEFQQSIECVKEARRLDSDSKNEILYKDGTSVPHYEAAMRARRERLQAEGRGGEVRR